MGPVTLPHREGFRVVRIGEFIKLVEEQEESTTPKYPYFNDNIRMLGTFFFNVISADTCRGRDRLTDYTFILRTSGLIWTGTPYLFDASRGPVEIPPYCIFWTINDSVILPQYLLLQLEEDYAKDQYITSEDLTWEENHHVFDNVLIYIPDGDNEFSLYEQQRLYNDRREKEISRLSGILNIGAAVNNVLSVNTLLQNGKYIIDDYISGGGFGKVYKAHTPKGHQIVAIKELFVKNYCSRLPYNSKVKIPEVAQQTFSRQRRKFQCEYAILSKLGKVTKYVPKVIEEPFSENNTIYYAMDYVSDGTLWKNCQSNSLTNKQVVNIICQAGIALHHAHDLDYLHLDVSPLNIMVDEDGNGILIDFGSNKHYSDEDGRISSVGQVAKTKSFAAPELLQQVVGQYYMQSDVYSLAASLYAALTGDIPFYHTKENDKEFTRHIVDKMRIMPSELSQPILKAMSSDVQDRPSTIREFLHSLPQDAMNPEILKEICSLKPVSGFNVKNHTAHNSEMQDSDYMPDYTSEEVSE